MELQAKLLLCDYAVVNDGKVTMVGAGWTERSQTTTPSAIGGVLEVPWSAAERLVDLVLELLDQDGHPVLSAEGMPVRLNMGLTIGPSPEDRLGDAAVIPLAIGLGPVYLPIGVYEWVLTAEGSHHGHWRLPFRVQSDDSIPQ